MRDPFCSWILTFVPKRSVLYTWMGNSQKRINNADLIDVVVLGRLYETSFNIVCLKLAKLETWKTSLSGFWNIEWAAILVRARTHWTIITRGRYSLLTIIRELILETSVLLFDIACRMIRCAYKLFVKFYIAGNSEGFIYFLFLMWYTKCIAHRRIKVHYIDEKSMLFWQRDGVHCYKI